MSNLRFRAWLPKENRWWNKGKSWDFAEMCGWEDWPRDCRIDELIIMQFTGLKDKNGKEIYQGDVIRLMDNPRFDAEVYWDFGAWQLRNGEKVGGQLGSFEAEDVEVIGDIYESPSLLKP